MMSDEAFILLVIKLFFVNVLGEGKAENVS
jgi:hypothetical protein